MKKIIKIFLRGILLLSAVIYPGLMAMLSAAAWRYQVQEGHYPEIFGAYSFWLFMGAGLILCSVLFCMIGAKPKFWPCNAVSLVSGVIGSIVCMTVLSKFCAYADQNFSGIGESMKPVSELYRDRLLPVLLPVFVMTVLSVWQFLESREYRIHKQQEKLALQNAEAPKILEDD